MRYLLAAGEVADVRKGISAYRKLWRALCRISELNIAILKAGRGGEAKGHGRRP